MSHTSHTTHTTHPSHASHTSHASRASRGGRSSSGGSLDDLSWSVSTRQVYIPLRSTDPGRHAQRVRMGRQRRDRHDGLLLACDQGRLCEVLGGLGVNVFLGESCRTQRLVIQSFARYSARRSQVCLCTAQSHGLRNWTRQLPRLSGWCQVYSNA
jgi:hypothetical protein